MLVVMTVLLGLAYPAVITLAAQVFPSQAGGSLVTTADSRVVGSVLLAQSLRLAGVVPARPSASGIREVSGGSNQSPVSAALRRSRGRRRAALERANPDAGPVPEDALTASASGARPAHLGRVRPLAGAAGGQGAGHPRRPNSRR
ncbi:MAG: potassium-transporting ATPase subunit C [Micropruina sp.]